MQKEKDALVLLAALNSPYVRTLAVAWCAAFVQVPITSAEALSRSELVTEGQWTASFMGNKGQQACGLGWQDTRGNRKFLMTYHVEGALRFRVIFVGRDEWELEAGQQTGVEIVLDGRPFALAMISNPPDFFEIAVDGENEFIELLQSTMLNSQTMAITFPTSKDPSWIVSLEGFGTTFQSAKQCEKDIAN